MSDCNHDWVHGAWSGPKCLHCFMRKEDFDRIAELDSFITEYQRRELEYKDHIAELEATIKRVEEPTSEMVEAAYNALMTATEINHNSIQVALTEAFKVALEKPE